MRVSGNTPFSRVDTNKVKSSSKKSLKQVSSQSKKGVEFGAMSSSYRNNIAISGFDSRRLSSNQPLPNYVSQAPNKQSSTTPVTKRVPTKSAIPSSSSKQVRTSGRKPQVSSIFTSVSKSQSCLPATPGGKNQMTTPKATQHMFRQEVTP